MTHRRAILALFVPTLIAACGPTAGSPSGGTSAAPTQVVSSQAATPAPTLVPDAAAFVSWDRIALTDPAPQADGGGTPTGVVRFGNGYVATGSIWAACCADGDQSLDSGVVWTSADGTTWALATSVTGLEHATLMGLLSDGARLLAYGTYAAPVAGGQGTAVSATWTSTDGTAWTRSTGAAPSVVAATAHGFVGAVVDLSQDGTGASTSRFVASADGLAWRDASPPLAAEVDGMAVGSDGRVVAVGSVPGPTAADGTTTTDLVVWRSSDGTSWPAPVDLVRGGWADAVAAVGSGYVVVGHVTEATGDGGSVDVPHIWKLLVGSLQPLGLTVGDQDTIDGVTAAGGAILAWGSTASDDAVAGVVWVSVDGGATFGAVPAQPAIGAPGDEISTILGTARGLLAMGRGWDASSGHPVPLAWTAAK